MAPPLRSINKIASDRNGIRKRNKNIVRLFYSVIFFLGAGLSTLTLHLFTQLGHGDSSLSTNTPGSPTVYHDTQTTEEKIQPAVCKDMLKDPSIFDPNKEDNKDERKRFTITEPPFWISLHNMWYDKLRWVHIMKTGEYYEKGVTSIFHQILSSYDLNEETQPPLVLDIGMNIGWFSLYSRAHGHDVAAFEPNPSMFLRVCESLEYNHWGGTNDKSVTLWQYGLGAQTGVFNLTTGNNPGSSSFHADRLAKKFRKSLPVPVTTLDTVAAQQGWLDRKISLLKVDVEGFEPSVFEGGKQMLSNGRVENLFMENSVTNSTIVVQMLDMLYDAGFRIKGIYTVNGDPYHEDWWDTFNPSLSILRDRGLMTEPSKQVKFLAKVTCNIWWVNSKYIKV